MSVIAIIPARGGSKGVERKNLRLLAGQPLIYYSIVGAQASKLVDQVYVSTDDREIAEVSRGYGAKVIDRPTNLAGDTASSEMALIHALSKFEQSNVLPTLVVFLQCTSPIRTGQDIDHAIAKIQADGADSLLSVSPSHRFLWQEIDGIAASVNYDYRHRPRRQDMTPQYVENGSIYIFKPWVLKELGNRLGGKISMFLMSELASWEIDSALDFDVVESLLKGGEEANVN